MSQDFQQQYYIVIDEQSTGPFSLEDLKRHPQLTPESLVWKPGIENWIAAKNLPELSLTFIQQPPHQEMHTQQNFNQNPYGANPQQQDNFNQNPYGANPQQQDNFNQNPFVTNPQQQDNFNQNQFNHNNYPPFGEHQEPQRYGEGHQPYQYNNPYPNNNQNYNQPYNSSQNQYQNPNRPYDNQYHHYHQHNNYNNKTHTNWMPWAIVATVLGFFFTYCIGLIFGIIGIVQANKANNFYKQGLFREGEAANSSAKTMTIISLIIAGVCILGFILYWIFVGTLFYSLTDLDYNY